MEGQAYGFFYDEASTSNEGRDRDNDTPKLSVPSKLAEKERYDFFYNKKKDCLAPFKIINGDRLNAIKKGLTSIEKLVFFKLPEHVKCDIKRVNDIAELNKRLIYTDGEIKGTNTLLRYCIRIGDYKGVEQLLASVDKKSADKKFVLDKTVINLAIKGHHLTIVKSFLEKKLFKIDEKIFIGYTALILAVQHNSMDLVKLCLQNGADVNKKGWCDRTPLMTAVAIDNLEMVEFLLSCKHINIDEGNRLDGKATKIAADHGNLEILKLLTQKQSQLKKERVQKQNQLKQEWKKKRTKMIKAVAHSGYGLIF